MSKRMVVARGGRTNRSAETPGGAELWADVWFRHGFRVQEHAITGQHRLLDPHEARRALGSFEHCSTVFRRIEVRPHEDPEHLVVLLHGLGRTRSSLMKLSRELTESGLPTAALAYATSRRPLDRHAAGLVSVLEGLARTKRVSFVTHGLGGILVRCALARPGGWRERIAPHRMVMLVPPSPGGTVERRLPRALLEGVLGHSAIEMADGQRRELGLLPIPCGVVTGSLEAGRSLHVFVPPRDERVVALPESELDELVDDRAGVALHQFLLNHHDVSQAVAHFLTEDAPVFD